MKLLLEHEESKLGHKMGQKTQNPTNQATKKSPTAKHTKPTCGEACALHAPSWEALVGLWMACEGSSGGV